MTHFHIAQYNIARMRLPITDPEMADLPHALEEIDALGKRADGFVWILEVDRTTDPTAVIAPYPDPLIIVNYTIWRDIDALWRFTYEGGHLDVLRRRRDWFTPLGGPQNALWWVPAGQLPPLDEAVARLEHLRAHGPTPHAFHFRQRFTPQQAFTESR
jgi:hypothetical protein